MVRRWLFVVLHVGGSILGCSSDDPCDATHAKFEACKAEIQNAVAASGHACFSASYSGECTAWDACAADCVEHASCADVADAIACPVVDPNSPPLSFAGVFACLSQCEVK
jgi:hypothetical protein